MTDIQDNAILVEDGANWVTIRQAAAILGLSSATVRRKFKSGEISGKTIATVAGDTYYLNLADVERVKSALGVLTVKRESSNSDMAFAVSRLISDYLSERDNAVLEKLNAQAEMIEGLQGTLNALCDELAAMREKAPEPAQKSLWERIFKV